jgi:hypothetical protein
MMVTCLFELGRILLILKPGRGNTLLPAALPAAEAASLCRRTREAKTTGASAAVVVALLALLCQLTQTLGSMAGFPYTV